MGIKFLAILSPGENANGPDTCLFRVTILSPVIHNFGHRDDVMMMENQALH
jgi:hypothetical protein